MTLDQARKIIEEIIEKHGHYCDYHEERREGEIKFLNLTLKLKIDKEKRDEVRRDNRIVKGKRAD